MSGPVAGGGRTYTVGQAPVLLTEYARQSDSDDVLVINLGNARVWLADGSHVGPSSGVPLDPGTALPWTTEGQVWAILDPSAAGTLQVLITSASTSWTPSPAAIALQVAEQLLLTGIPNVYTEETVYNATIGSAPVILDVSGFASIAVIESYFFGPPGDSGVQLDWLSSDPAITDVISTDYVHGVMRLPCVSGRVRITNLTGGTTSLAVKVIGTNRTTARTRASETQKIDHWTSTQNPWVAATTYTFAQDDANVQLEGDCYLYVLVSGSQALKGRLLIRQKFTALGPTLDVPFASFDEAINGGATVQSLNKKIAVPAVPFNIGFLCSTGTAGAATIDVYLTKCQP